jgi:hypothetical protein
MVLTDDVVVLMLELRIRDARTCGLGLSKSEGSISNDWSAEPE